MPASFWRDSRSCSQGRKGVCDLRHVGVWNPVAAPVNSHSGLQCSPSKNRHQSPLAPAHLGRLNGEQGNVLPG
jgi:hypothetical protein